MRRVSVAKARQQLRSLLDEAATGEEVAVLRRGKEVARIVPPKNLSRRLPSLRAFRRSITLRGAAMSRSVVRERADGRY
jgi:prevent-host-death family protein